MNAFTKSVHWHDYLFTAAAPVIWGSTYIVTSQLLPPNHPFAAALIRVLPAGLLLVLLVLPLRHLHYLVPRISEDHSWLSDETADEFSRHKCTPPPFPASPSSTKLDNYEPAWRQRIWPSNA